MATLHLCQYIPHPLMIMLLLLTPPLLLAHAIQHLPLGLLGIVGLGPPMVYVVSQQALYPDWKRRLLAFPVLVALGTGIAWSNTEAVVGGLFGMRTEFRRTPKFAHAWQSSGYALHNDKGLWIELFLAAYASWGVYLALRLSPALAPYLAIYSFAFGLVAMWGLYDRWLVAHRPVRVE